MSDFITKDQLTHILQNLRFEGDTHCHCEPSDYCCCSNRIEVDCNSLDKTVARYTEDDEEKGYNLYSVEYVKNLKDEISNLKEYVEQLEDVEYTKKEYTREHIRKELDISYDLRIKRLESNNVNLENKLKRLEQALGISVDALLDKLYLSSLKERNDYLEEVLKDFEEDMGED